MDYLTDEVCERYDAQAISGESSATIFASLKKGRHQLTLRMSEIGLLVPLNQPRISQPALGKVQLSLSNKNSYDQKVDRYIELSNGGKIQITRQGVTFHTYITTITISLTYAPTGMVAADGRKLLNAEIICPTCISSNGSGNYLNETTWIGVLPYETDQQSIIFDVHGQTDVLPGTWDIRLPLDPSP